MKLILGCICVMQLSAISAFAYKDVKTNQLRTKTEKVVEYEIGKSMFFKKNNKALNSAFPSCFFYNNNELYMYNVEREITVFNTKTKNTYQLSTINSFIKRQYADNGISGFFVKGDSIYIGISANKILLFNKNTEKLIREYSLQSFSIKNFSVFDNDVIIGFNVGSFFKLSSNNSIVVKKTVNTDPVIVKMNKGILALSDAFGPSVYFFSEKSDNSIEKFYFGNDDEEDIVFSALTNSYLVFINSSQTGLWVCNRKNKVKNFVYFDTDFLKVSRQLPLEDLLDGIRVVSENDITYYFLIMKNNKIQIYKVTLPR